MTHATISAETVRLAAYKAHDVYTHELAVARKQVDEERAERNKECNQIRWWHLFAPVSAFSLGCFPSIASFMHEAALSNLSRARSLLTLATVAAVMPDGMIVLDASDAAFLQKWLAPIDEEARARVDRDAFERAGWHS